MNVYSENHFLRRPVRKGDCMAVVYDRWRIDVVGRQCDREAKETVNGVPLCTQHAKQHRQEAPMTPVDQMTCEELEETPEHLIAMNIGPYDRVGRALDVLAELKSRRLAAGAG